MREKLQSLAALQTVDVEITPREPGTLRLEPRAAAGPALGAVVMNVSP